MRNAPPVGPVALYLGTYGGPRGVGVSYERGTPDPNKALFSLYLSREDPLPIEGVDPPRITIGPQA
jgi:hypothetical protein